MAPEEMGTDPDSSASASPSRSMSASPSASASRPRSVIRSRVIGGPVSSGYQRVQQAIYSLSDSETGDVQKIAASQIELLSGYYDAVLTHANKSFNWALVAALVGLGFFAAAIAFLLYTDSQQVAVIGTIGGTLVEVIAGINFVLYGKTTTQLSHFHGRLDQTQRFLLANSICESLDEDVKQVTRSKLVSVIPTLELPEPEKPASRET